MFSFVVARHDKWHVLLEKRHGELETTHQANSHLAVFSILYSNIYEQTMEKNLTPGSSDEFPQFCDFTTLDTQKVELEITIILIQRTLHHLEESASLILLIGS